MVSIIIALIIIYLDLGKLTTRIVRFDVFSVPLILFHR